MVFVGRFFNLKKKFQNQFVHIHKKNRTFNSFERAVGSAFSATVFEKRRIFDTQEAGFSSLEITRQLNRSHSALLRISSLWSKEGIQHRRPGSGRSKRTNEREDRRLRQLSVRDRFRPSAEMEWIG
jgi:hypothetical protein